MQAAVFKDPQLEQQFNELGYAVIPGFLSKKVVAGLYALYKAAHTTVDPGQLQWNSLYEMGYERGLALSGKIIELVLPAIERNFQDVAFPVATFMSKNPVAGSTCEVHRDFTTLNENQFQFRNLWIPLIDINQQNGALYVVPKSHLLFSEIRPMFSKWPVRPFAKRPGEIPESILPQSRRPGCVCRQDAAWLGVKQHRRNAARGAWRLIAPGGEIALLSVG